MSAPLLSRLAMRQSRALIQRRAASSTTAEAANAASSGATKAKESAQQVASKAQQGLSRVTSSAGPALANATAVASRAVSGIGGRTGAAIKFVQSIIPPAVYYARVTGELAKAIYTGRGMQPPNMQTVQSYLTPLTNAIRNPASLASRSAQAAEKSADQAINNPQSYLTRLRSLDAALLTSIGIVAAETIGFFSVGEIIGRFKLGKAWESAAQTIKFTNMGRFT